MNDTNHSSLSTEMVINGSPAFSHTLAQFILDGNRVDAIYPTFSKMSYLYKYGNFKYCVKNVIDDYLLELKEMSVIVKFNKDEMLKYNYKPKLLSLDVYGVTDLYYLILLLNGMIDVKEFHNIEYLRLIPKDIFKDVFASIFKNELSSIKAYNSIHV